MKLYLIDYRMDGSEWNLEIPALSFEDAERRLSALALGRVTGEIVAKIPAHSGWIAALAVWVRNWWKYP